MPQLIIKIDLDASAESVERAHLENTQTTLANDVRRLSHDIEMLGDDLEPFGMKRAAVDIMGRPVGEWWIE